MILFHNIVLLFSSKKFYFKINVVIITNNFRYKTDLSLLEDNLHRLQVRNKELVDRLEEITIHSEAVSIFIIIIILSYFK